MSNLIKLNKSQSKALYAAIGVHCKNNGYSPYSFGYAAGVSHNYVYRLKDARSASYNGMAIKKIVNALGHKHLEDVIDPKAKPQQKDKPKDVEVVVTKKTAIDNATKYESLSRKEQEAVVALIHRLWERAQLKQEYQVKIDKSTDQLAQFFRNIQF